MNKSKKRSLTSIVDDIDYKRIKQAIINRKQDIEKTKEKCLNFELYNATKKQQETQLINYIFEELLEYIVDMLINGIQLKQKNITSLLSHSFETAKIMYSIIDIDVNIFDIIPTIKNRLNAVIKSKIDDADVGISYTADVFKKNVFVFMTITLPIEKIDEISEIK
jgi:hypothetical protein